MYFIHNRIPREVYDYCITNKLVDAALIAKWKKPGYERLCSTYAINPRNYKFGTVSICRVPKHSLPSGTEIEDPTTGCRGCSSDSGRGNIFGNKYGQYLAAIQIAREDKLAKQAATAEDDDNSDDEGFQENEDTSNSNNHKRSNVEVYSGPVGAADGSSGELPSVWSENAGQVTQDDHSLKKMKHN